VLELLHFADAKLVGREPRVMNELGLTHISVSVDDVDAFLARVPEYGGTVLADTNIGLGVFVRDPDGQLLEVLPMSYRAGIDG
jgi:catechol 2,3-dioxygenase-like lactoylglutathione lyase family enzyme